MRLRHFRLKHMRTCAHAPMSLSMVVVVVVVVFVVVVLAVRVASCKSGTASDTTTGGYHVLSRHAARQPQVTMTTAAKRLSLQMVSAVHSLSPKRIRAQAQAAKHKHKHKQKHNHHKYHDGRDTLDCRCRSRYPQVYPLPGLALVGA